MVLKATQDRVGTLIKDTITLLCKNGLEFQKKFKIEAVIGVTLDDGDILLVSMNELVKSDNAPPSDQEDDAPDTTSEKKSVSTSKLKSPGKHKSHKRKHEESHTPETKVKIKKEPGDSDQDIPQEQENSGDLVNPKTEDLWGKGDPPSLSLSAPDDSNSQQYPSELNPAEIQEGTTNNDPTEDDNEDDDNMDDEDLVFIKEEASDTPSRPSCSRRQSIPGRSPQSQYSPGSTSYSPQQGFSFSGFALEPLSQQDGSSLWSQSGQQMRGQSFARAATATSGSFNPSQQQWQQQSQSPAQGQQQMVADGLGSHQSDTKACSTCGKLFTSKYGLKLHEDRHKGIFPYHCAVCGKGFCSTSQLSKHMASHIGAKAFNCSLCEEAFDYKNDLKAHVGSVHKVMYK